jgi:hypothetical protein
VAIAHDANTRFPTTDGTVGVNSVDTTTGDRTFSHAGSASAKGAVVVVLCTGNTAVVSGVLYGGVAMALTQTAVDATEAGRVDIYVLADQASFPTGTQTVTLQGCTATQKWATCSTVTCSVGSRSRLNASNFKDTTAAANPTLTVVTSTNPTMLYGGLHGGAASPASYVVTANYTSQHNNDYGALSARTSRSTSEVAAGSIVYDFSFATSDDYCIAAVALEEYTPAALTPAIYPVMAPRLPS